MQVELLDLSKIDIGFNEVFEDSDDDNCISMQNDVTTPTQNMEEEDQKDDGGYNKETGFSFEKEGGYNKETESDEQDEVEKDNEESEDESAEELSDDNDEDDEQYEKKELAIVFLLSDSYRFVKLITKSKSSTSIWKALDASNGLPVCIKICQTSQNSCPIEVKTLEHIRRKGGNHHIQELLAVLHCKDIAWIIVSRHNHSSKNYEVNHLFGQYDKLDLFITQLLEAVAFLHANGILHRDIKPSNILWDNITKKLVLCDFDCATWNHEKGHCSNVGTEGYIAPEVLQFARDGPLPRKPYFQAIDLYSVGCVYAGLVHAITETHMRESYIHKWRLKYQTSSCEKDQLFIALVNHDTSKRISASLALETLLKKQN